jgi:hypothetical protein
MGNFIIPDGPMLQPAPPAPPPDPRVARAEKIANDTRVESELNRFIASRQDAMFNNPDAFYRTEGENAIHAAPVARKNLEQLRDNLLDGLANDYQRQRLGAALDAQMQLTRQQMARHVAEQSLAWQRGVAQDRIDLLAKEAALHHNDDDLIDGLGAAAANAARAHTRVGDGPVDADRENAAAATARSRVVSSAIQARLDKGQTQGAVALFDRVRDQLDPAHAGLLQTQILDIQKGYDQTKQEYQLVPVLPDTDYEIGAPNTIFAEQKQDNDTADPEQPSGAQSVPAPDRDSQKRIPDEAEVLSDASPEPVLPDRRYAQAGGGRPSNRSGRILGAEPAETLAGIRVANFQSHIETIRKLEPNNPQLSYVAPKGWVPTERDVTRIHEELLRARERVRGELLPNRNTLEPGPYAGESIPARSSKRDFTVQERATNDRIGYRTGCHTCGTRNPGTKYGNFVLDHQPATGLNSEGSGQRLFPQCLSCSSLQGGQVNREIWKGER